MAVDYSLRDAFNNVLASRIGTSGLFSVFDGFKRTDVEIAAGVTPVNYFTPNHEALGGIFLVRRYGTNTTPGTTVMDTPIANAIAVAYQARGGTVRFDPEIYKITQSIVQPAYVFLEGTYGESNYPFTLPGGGTANTGTQILWGGGANGKMLYVFNAQMTKLDGFDFNGNGNTTVTAIWLDSTNDPSGYQSEFWRFNIRDCFRGVQWGTSGIAGGAYSNQARFSTFTIWSSVANSVGFTVNSGNVGQQGTIEFGGIQVQDLGIDLQVSNIMQINRVFGGGQMNSGFIKAGIAIDTTIEGCSSECWGPGRPSRSDLAYFLKTVQPTEAYPLVESCITLIGNQINNPIVLDYPARIVSTGDNWGYCAIQALGFASGPAIGTASAAPAYSGATAYVANKHVVSSGGINYLCIANTTGNAPPNVTYWSPTLGKSRVLALNNGRNPGSIDITTGPHGGRPTHGWIDGPYINLDIQDPALGFIQPGYVGTYFTTNGAGGWTVDAGDLEYYGYKLNGQTMTISFRIITSSVIAAVGNELRIAIPAGKIVAQPMCNTVARLLDNGVLAPAFVTADSGNAYIHIQRQDLANFTASANTTQVKGQITFMVL